MSGPNKPLVDAYEARQAAYAAARPMLEYGSREPVRLAPAAADELEAWRRRRLDELDMVAKAFGIPREFMIDRRLP